MVHGLCLSDLLKEWNGPDRFIQWPHVKLRPRGLAWQEGLPASIEEKVMHVNWYNFVHSRAMTTELREMGGYWQNGEWIPLKNDDLLVTNVRAR